MTRTWYLLTLLLTLVTAQAEPAPAPATQPAIKWGPVLNRNGGFEDGKSMYYFTRPSAASIDGDEVYRGQFSLRLQGEALTNLTENNICVQGFDIPAPTPQTRYLLRIAVKARNVDPQFPPAVELRASRGKGLAEISFPENQQLVIRGDYDWKVMQIVVSKLPADIKSLGFWLVMPHQSKATVWFDEIEIRESGK